MPVAKGTGIAPHLERPTGSPAGAFGLRPGLTLRVERRARAPSEHEEEETAKASAGCRFRTGGERRLRFSRRVRRLEQAGFALVARVAKRVARRLRFSSAVRRRGHRG